MIRGLDTLFVLAFIADTAVLKQRVFGLFFFFPISNYTHRARAVKTMYLSR